LVFLIAGLLSLVYVSQLLKAAVKHLMTPTGWWPTRCGFACNRSRDRLTNRKVDPTILTIAPLAAEAVRDNTCAAGGGRIGEPLLAHSL